MRGPTASHRPGKHPAVLCRAAVPFRWPRSPEPDTIRGKEHPRRGMASTVALAQRTSAGRTRFQRCAVAEPDWLLIPYEDFEGGRFNLVGQYGAGNQFMAFVTGAFPADWWSGSRPPEYLRSRW